MTACAAEVHADVKPLRLHCFLQHAHHPGERLRDLQLGAFAEIIEPGDVPTWGYSNRWPLL